MSDAPQPRVDPRPELLAIVRASLWRRNVGLVQLLGLCPMLAVSSQVATALGLGLATILVMAMSGLLVSLARPFLTPETRIASFVVIIASIVTTLELCLQAWANPLHGALGIFLPLIVTNCAILARAEAFASRNPPLAAMVDGAASGVGFAAVLVALGALRELAGRGTLFSRMDLLFGEWGRGLELRFADGGLLLALLPPGAFIGLGCLVALYRWVEDRRDQAPASAPAESRP